jgi:hypothetical protein
MILELADTRILAGRQSDFDEAIQLGLTTILAGAEGFRQSPLFQQWRAIVGPYFAAQPAVEHFELLGKSTGG